MGVSKVHVVDSYLGKVPVEFRDLVRELDALILQADPRLVRSLKWGNLTYHRDRNVCAIVTHRDHVNVQLWAGASLEDPKRLLRGSGKQMRHVRLRTGERVDRGALAALVRATSRICGDARGHQR